MVVIAAQRGLSSCASMMIEFEIDEGQMSLISLWQSRNQTNCDVSQSLCLTLACYRWADVLPTSQRVDDTPLLEELTSGASCSWPRNGGLSVVVRYNETDWQLPLSPPVCESSENLVDISQFVRPKQNTIRILQTRDMSGFLFVLHAHSPTQQQLQVVDENREADQTWSDYLEKWKQPVDVPMLWGGADVLVD